MYIPSHFEISDREELFTFLANNAFGQLVSTVNGRPFVSHLPFLLSDDRSRLTAHVARPNPQYSDIEGQEVLVTFAGPHDYVSPSWYEGPGVPTWNYQAVHVYGRCRVFTDADELRALLGELTKRYEVAFEEPWQPQYKAAMLGAIVGLDITITELQGKYKLSQNKSEAEQQHVAEQLRMTGSVALAEAMERCNG